MRLAREVYGGELGAGNRLAPRRMVPVSAHTVARAIISTRGAGDHSHSIEAGRDVLSSSNSIDNPLPVLEQSFNVRPWALRAEVLTVDLQREFDQLIIGLHFLSQFVQQYAAKVLRELQQHRRIGARIVCPESFDQVFDAFHMDGSIHGAV